MADNSIPNSNPESDHGTPLPTSSSNEHEETYQTFQSLEDATSSKHISNRVHFFSIAVSVLAPLINFCYSWPYTNSIDGNQAIVIWTLFGIYWSAACSLFLGPIFACGARLFSSLNFIPGFGSSLWAVFNIFVIRVVIDHDTDIFHPLRNFPLFSLIFANLCSLKYYKDLNRREAGPNALPMYNDLASTLFFRGGRAESLVFPNLFQRTIAPYVSVSQKTLDTFHTLQSRSRSHYSRGERMEQLEEDLEEWIGCIPHFRRVFFTRKLLFALGCLFEATALFVSVKTFTRIVFASEFVADLVFEIFSSDELAILLYFVVPSHFFRVALRIENTFSTTAESRALSMMRMECEKYDLSCSMCSYVQNGQRPLKLHKKHPENKMVPYSEAATLGLVRTDEEDGGVVLESRVGLVKLRVYRKDGYVLGTKLYDEECTEVISERIDLNHDVLS